MPDKGATTGFPEKPSLLDKFLYGFVCRRTADAKTRCDGPFGREAIPFLKIDLAKKLLEDSGELVIARDGSGGSGMNGYLAFSREIRQFPLNITLHRHDLPRSNYAQESPSRWSMATGADQSADMR